MAFCPNCGAQLDGAKKFCTGCGQPVQATEQPAQAAQPQQQQAAATTPQPVQQPAYQPTYQNQAPEKKRKSKAPIIIIIVVLLIAAIGAAAFFTNGFGLFGGGGDNPSGGDPTGTNSGGNSTPSSTPGGDNNPTSTPGGNDPGNIQLPLSNEWIQLEKTNFAPGETMVITVTGVTQQMTDTARPEIRIYRKGETNANSYHLDFASVEVGTTRRELNAPAENGEYEIQLHDSGNTYSSNVISILAFTVGNAQGGNDPTTTSNPGNNPASTPGGNSPTSNPGNDGEIPESVNNDIEFIKELMKSAGYEGTLITKSDTLFGASACLYYANANKGMVQIYFYPTRQEAVAGKEEVWDKSAKDLGMVCKIANNFVYVGSEEFVAVIDNFWA